MNNRIITLLFLLGGIVMFDLLFWQESLGLNIILFSALLIAFSIWINQCSIKRKEVQYSLIPVIITGFMVVWNNSGWSVFMHFLAVFICLGFIKQERITTVFEGFLAFVLSYFSAPINFIKRLNSQSKDNRLLSIAFSFIKLCVIPIIVFFLFFIIYKNANPKFDELTLSFSEFFAGLFKDFQFSRIVFLLFGLSFLLLAVGKKLFKMKALAPYEDVLFRKRKKHNPLAYRDGGSAFSDLLNEKKVGILIFSVLNLLLLFVNLIDIDWIWIGFEVPEEFNLMQFVHEGTYLLIFSILLSMGIVIYFFRGSLNFYPKNRWLRLLGKLWVVQNIILTLSVFLRNYHYISYHGLAGKRIGVIVFLVMTIFGLGTLIVKLDKLKTTAYLVRKNGWFILYTMVLMSCLNWDRIIVNYNLSHENTGEIDVDYYLKLSPTVAPILLKNLDVIEDQMEAHKNRAGKAIYINTLDINYFKEMLEYKTSQYLLKQKEYSWVSWNRADWRLLNQVVIEENE